MSGAVPPGPDPRGYYPQEAYYAPGWQQPVTPPPPRRRRWPVVAVVVAGLLVLGGATAGVVALLARAQTAALGEVSEARDVASRQLRVGHCVETLSEDGAVDRVTAVPCDQPHTAEVVGVHTLSDGEWPGQEPVVEEATAACEMDRRQQDAGFRPVVWTPSAGSWGAGDRAALCLAWSPTGAVTGSWTAGDDVVGP